MGICRQRLVHAQVKGHDDAGRRGISKPVIF